MEKLIINFDKETLKSGLFVMPFLCLSCIFFIFLIHHSFLCNFGYLGIFIENTIKFLLGFFVFIIVLCVPYILYLIYSNQPAAVLTQEGIYIPRFGLIPWSTIEKIDRCPAPVEYLGISVKNTKELWKQASFSGKMELFWARIFGYPHIKLSSVDVSNNDIIQFAKRFRQ